MSFIRKQDPIVLNIKLTSKGRELLSQGNLNFKYFSLGDSEIDYNLINEIKQVDSEYTPYNSSILKPFDNNPSIISKIRRNGISGDSYTTINNLITSPFVVENVTETIGFFNDDCTQFNVDPDHVKQPDCMVEISKISGGTNLYFKKSPTYGNTINEPSEGDFILIKWGYDISTTGYTIHKDSPRPYLWYKIKNIVSGSLSSNDLLINVDRELPDFSPFNVDGLYSGVLVYYNVINYTGNTLNYSTDYLTESVLTFYQNANCDTVIYPFWNMSIVFAEDIAGVTNEKTKYTQYKNKEYAGFISYIQNQTIKYRKLGIIHYTNPSPSNVYGEGFYLNTPVIKLPTIMWHLSTGNTMGVTLSAYGNEKILTGTTKSLNVKYYDLADETGNIVGKIFIDMKIFLIEDQELLFAMSYKSNRNWTLPNFKIGRMEYVVNELTPETPSVPTENNFIM